jgi:aryl-alcohol dehydrogenase-like predicted oxidoreductase
LEYKQLGRSGLTVSVAGLGANNFGRRNSLKETLQIVNAAFDLGVNFIDTADQYGNGSSEELLGEVLKGRRHSVVLATKVGGKMAGSTELARGSRRYIRWEVENSLRRLQTDFIDLYYLHRPDPLTPIEETLAAMEELVKDGKVRYIGSSNFTGWQIADAEWTARHLRTTRFIAAQNEYHLLNRRIESEVTPACLEYGIGIVTSRPLAHGFLTGKYQRGEAPPAGTRLAVREIAKADMDFDLIDALQDFSRQRAVTLLDVAFGYVLHNRAVVSVIAGATSIEQLQANALAIRWRPTAEDLEALEEILAMPLSAPSEETRAR